MKSIVIIILSALFLVSCQSNPSKDYIVLTGTISGASKKEFRLYKRNSYPDKKRPTFTIITLAEDGSFSSDTITTGTGYYSFRDRSGINAADLYLTNGGAYNLTAVGEKFKNTAKLTGPNSDASNYLLSKSAHNNRLEGDYSEFISLNESDFIAKQKILYESAVSYLDSFPNIPKEFAEKERQELYYRNILTLTEYEGLHREYANQPNFKVSPDFIKQFEGVDYANEALYKRGGYYRRMLASHFEIKADIVAEEEEEEEENKRYLAKLKVYEAIPNDYIKSDLVSTEAEYDLGYIDGIDNIDAYYKAYMAISTSTKNNEMITKKYEGLKKLSAGQPSPIFENYVNHAGGTTSLSDFKGKYVYIDVWATWCGPCIQEVPFLNEVEKQFHGKNIEFVSVSIDEDLDKWKKMVTDDALFGGVQLIADKQFNSDFIEGYQVNAIPLFVLIDPDGNIVTRNVPRPSDPSLVALLKKLTI